MILVYEFLIAYLFELAFFLGHLSAIVVLLSHVSAIAPTLDIQANAPVGLTRVAARLESVRKDPSHQHSFPLITDQESPNML